MSECLYNPASSRVCERGSKCCVVPHEPLPVATIVPGRTERCQVIVRGGRDIVGDPMPMSKRNTSTRGQDIQVVARGEDGKMFRLPATGLVLRVDGRRAVATVNLIVDEVELTAIEIVEKISMVQVNPEKIHTADGKCCPECRDQFPVDPEIAISRTKTKEETDP